MSETPNALELSPQERAVWGRVNELWLLAQQCDEPAIRDALHPDYTGWDMNSPLPHDREAAVGSVARSGRQLESYALQLHSARVYEGRTGVVHYSYSATLEANGKQSEVTGRWTEVYLLHEGTWLMVAVSGRPDPS